jgi:hypothetical protein
MGKLRILATGNSPQAQAEARGKLFEKLMAEVLRHYGYSIDRIANVNYAGMEIDIDGKAIATDTPLYAECKCLGTEVDSPRFQAFYGKYMSRSRISIATRKGSTRKTASPTTKLHLDC